MTVLRLIRGRAREDAVRRIAGEAATGAASCWRREEVGWKPGGADE